MYLRTTRQQNGQVLILLSFLVYLVASVSSWAQTPATISKVQGTKALIQSDANIDLQEGQEVFLINAENKKIGLGKVTIVKGNKAQLEVLKGKVEVGNTFAPRNKPAAAEDSSAADSSAGASKVPKKKSRWAASLVAGLSLDTINLTAQDTFGLQKKISLTGTSFASLLGLDMALTDELSLRGQFGTVGFNTTSSVASTDASYCGGTANCSIQFQYLAFIGYGIWYPLTTNSFRWGIGGGYAYYLRSTGTTTVTNFDATVSSNSAFVGMTELDYILKKNKYAIPLILEYRSYAGGSSIAASSIGITAGFIYSF